MLAEGFLRLLCYREERKFASKQKGRRTSSQCSGPLRSPASDPNSAGSQRISAEAGPNQEVLSTSHDWTLRGVPQVPGLRIPRCSPVTTLHPVCIEDCSLLEHYPDLQVADSGRISHNLLRPTVNPEELYIQPAAPELGPLPGAHQEEDSVSSITDQGYLVMGGSVDVSLDLPGSGLEPMSNSVLNGLLEKQLEEVYMQHLTDNLARCNSRLENSLLRSLVPPPQPGCQSKGLYSLETSLEKDSRADSSDKISYLSTQNLVPCSSNFSSPVLRISDVDHPHLPGDALPK
ncbi:uncharacterized protein si:dkey-237j10.2 [Kryptolebias marmoratus]|uniref:uncharacterized protein si:dkey-237j10.2 n=1 Tax=Kryptolebias marmoratus TaxID=37003 RepID=UPI000D530CAC|nr:uncharacterized protein si:dkey-237j10.2 [Kryptolebias marmoratus]